MWRNWFHGYQIEQPIAVPQKELCKLGMLTVADRISQILFSSYEHDESHHSFYKRNKWIPLAEKYASVLMGFAVCLNSFFGFWVVFAFAFLGGAGEEFILKYLWCTYVKLGYLATVFPWGGNGLSAADTLSQSINMWQLHPNFYMKTKENNLWYLAVPSCTRLL